MQEKIRDALASFLLRRCNAILKLIVRLLVGTSRQYRQMLGLLEQNLREWREIARLDNTYGHYAEVGADVLLMYGGRSDSKAVDLVAARLPKAIPHVTLRAFPRLDHFGIERTAPREVARAVGEFFAK